MKKPTRWLSNSPCVLQALSRRCQGRGGLCSRPQGGHHVTVSGKESRRSQFFPFEVCKAILAGFRKQLVEDGRLVIGVAGIQRPEEDLSDVQLERIARRTVVAEDGKELFKVAVDEEFRDSLTGQLLQPELVRAARRKELEYFAAKEVWRKVPREEAQKHQGKPPYHGEVG